MFIYSLKSSEDKDVAKKGNTWNVFLKIVLIGCSSNKICWIVFKAGDKNSMCKESFMIIDPIKVVSGHPLK